MGSLAQFVNSYPEFGKIIETIRFDHFLIKNFTEYSTTVVDCYWAFFLISWFLWRLVGIWQPCPTCPVPARQNLTSPLTCQTGLPSQIERVGSNPLFAQNLTSELSLAKSYGFGLRFNRIPVARFSTSSLSVPNSKDRLLRRFIRKQQK